MDESYEKDDRSPPIEAVELGRASQATRGSTILFPWYESSPPPFDRRCPTC